MPDSGKKIEVVLVEDDMFLRKILSTKFEKEGFGVRAYPDCENALEDLRDNALPDMLLTDLILPSMSGFDLITEIRRDSKLKDLPVIVLSNLSQEEDVNRVSELGALAFITKADNSINHIVSRVKEEFAKLNQ
jgi:DNA-binding response OmpR family regulator